MQFVRIFLVFLGFALVQSAWAQPAYLDDRSSPEAVVLSLYDAINARDFARAWSYFDPDDAPSYSAYVRGFADTASVIVRTGSPVSERSAGEGQAWFVPVVLVSRQTDDREVVYSGCYALAQDPPRSRPPYAPIQITGGHFHVHDGPASTAIGDCAWVD